MHSEDLKDVQGNENIHSELPGGPRNIRTTLFYSQFGDEGLRRTKVPQAHDPSLFQNPAPRTVVQATEVITRTAEHFQLHMGDKGQSKLLERVTADLDTGEMLEQTLNPRPVEDREVLSRTDCQRGCFQHWIGYLQSVHFLFGMEIYHV